MFVSVIGRSKYGIAASAFAVASAVLSLVLSLVLSPSSAQAAHWEVQYSASGGNTTSTGGTAPLLPLITQWGTTSSSPPPTWFPYPAASGNSGPSYWAQSKADVTATLRWTRDSSETTLPPAPTELSVIIDSKVTGSGRGGGLGWTADLDNGFGAEQQVIPNSPPSSTSFAVEAKGRYLRTLTVQGGMASITRSLKAKVNLTGSSSLGAAANLYFTVSPINIKVVTPDPNADVTKGQNEYVMSGGIFSIPCVVSIDNGNSTDVEYYRQRSSWSLSRALSNSLPATVNGLSGSSFFPQFLAQTNNQTYVMSGLGWYGLPANNSEFGFRYVNHNINGIQEQSPIEVFYDRSARTHPPGGPEGWSDSAWYGVRVDIPNLVYYYNQAWTPPCTIKYRDELNTAYAPGADFIWLGTTITTPLDTSDLFGFVTDSLGRERLRHVGLENSKGIDLYARTIMHEYTHMRCYEAINPEDNDGDPFSPEPLNALSDSDGDDVPDAWEIAVGLNPNDSNETNVGWTFDGYSSSENGREIFARLYERGVQGDASKDWADSGLNHGPVFDPVRYPSLATIINRNPHEPDAGITVVNRQITGVRWPSLP